MDVLKNILVAWAVVMVVAVRVDSLAAPTSLSRMHVGRVVVSCNSSGGGAVRVSMATTVEPETSAKLDEPPEIFPSNNEPAHRRQQRHRYTASSTYMPGIVEDVQFRCDPSVQFWRELHASGIPSDAELAQELAAVGAWFARQGPDALEYWLRHMVTRSGYFVGNALLGLAGFRVDDLLNNGGRGNANTIVNNFQNAQVILTRLLDVAYGYQQDYQRIQTGQYAKPYDMYAATPQRTPWYALDQSVKLVRESIGVFGRRYRGDKTDKDVWLTGPHAPSLYPPYYRTAFHYQTDGWMSAASAQAYEVSTETLFLGGQDAMQRTALPGILKGARSSALKSRPPRVLEIACGTGRFGTFIRDNLPSSHEYTAVDLSPFYLDQARINDQMWRDTKVKMTGVDPGPATIVQAQAEQLPFANDSFDAVVCVYLFHELPRPVRAQVAAEMARVCQPGGGTVTLTDSIQRGDRRTRDATMHTFTDMNEPYYGDYIVDDLAAHFTAVGLQCDAKITSQTTKSLSFLKPSRPE